MRALIAITGILLLALLGLTAAIVVDETEHVVVTQFGRPVAVHSEAGLYIKAPAPLQRTTRFDKRILFSPGLETELLTADKKNVLVSTYLSWRIADPLKYLTTLRTRDFAEARLRALVQSELGSALGDLPFDALVPADSDGAGLAQLEQRVHAASSRVAASDFGIEVTSLGITRLSFPTQNLTSVFARMRAERERIARGFRSEGKSEAQKIRAKADRERADILATAEAEAARLRGAGEADAARTYAEAYGDHAEFYAFLRTLESYEKVLNGNTTLVLPADSPFLELLLSRRPPSAGTEGR